MRIIAQCFIWNGSKFISACILAIHKYVDEIQVFDGAFAHMKTLGIKTPESTDGTKEIVMGLAPKLACPVKWFSCQDFWKTETAKKTFMLKYWHPDEWMFRLGSDELPVGNVRAAFERIRREEKALVGCIPMIEMRLKNGIPHLVKIDDKPRFFRWQEGLHWKGCHWAFYNGQDIFRGKWAKIVLDEMRLLHLKYLRKEETLQAQLSYEKLGI